MLNFKKNEKQKQLNSILENNLREDLEWKTIEGFSNYEVSELGHVRKIKSKKLIKQQLNNCDYLRVLIISDLKKRHQIFVHRQVGLYFVENPYPDFYTIIDHDNSIKTDNNKTNLVWRTRRQNNQKIRRNKLSLVMAEEIRDLYNKSGYSVKSLAELYNVSKSNIYNTLSGRIWKDCLKEIEETLIYKKVS